MADIKTLTCARQQFDSDEEFSGANNALSFTIDWEPAKSTLEKENLQKSFLKFKKERQREVRQMRKMKKREREAKCDPVRMQALREKFLNQVKKYFGIPYARKYWPKDSPEYNSPLFLDCCALVRKAVRDLSKEFGFYLGAWNQAYQYDTLPISIDREDMQPGDLVFMSGIYQNSKSKKQRHNMTHVEIWLGEGEKVIGSRWNNGKVQVFDTYRFEPKSFHSEQYHFKSIDTWLKGICKSYCPKHPWRRFKHKPGKKSVFNPDEQFINAEQDDSIIDIVTSQSSSEALHPGIEPASSQLSLSQSRPESINSLLDDDDDDINKNDDKNDEDDDKDNDDDDGDDDDDNDDDNEDDNKDDDKDDDDDNKDDDKDDDDDNDEVLEQLNECSESQDQLEVIHTKPCVQMSFNNLADSDTAHTLSNIQPASQDNLLIPDTELSGNIMQNKNSTSLIPEKSFLDDITSPNLGKRILLGTEQSGNIKQNKNSSSLMPAKDFLDDVTSPNLGKGTLLDADQSSNIISNTSLSSLMHEKTFLDDVTGPNLRRSVLLCTGQMVDDLDDSGMVSAISTSCHITDLSYMSTPVSSETETIPSAVSDTCNTSEIPYLSSTHSVTKPFSVPNTCHAAEISSQSSTNSSEVKSKPSDSESNYLTTELPCLSSFHSKEIKTKPSESDKISAFYSSDTEKIPALYSQSCPDFSEIVNPSVTDTFNSFRNASSEVNTKSSAVLNTSQTTEFPYQSSKHSIDMMSESGDFHSDKISCMPVPSYREMTITKNSVSGDFDSGKNSSLSVPWSGEITTTKNFESGDFHSGKNSCLSVSGSGEITTTKNSQSDNSDLMMMSCLEHCIEASVTQSNVSEDSQCATDLSRDVKYRPQSC